MLPFLHFLAQIDNLPINEGKPMLNDPATMGTSGLTWIIAAILTAGILLITFKTSKRNHHLERD